MLSSNFVSPLVLGFSLASLVVAVPAPAPAVQPRADSVSQVIPGPGLPSLESLGLTSEMLYAMGKPATTPSDDTMSIQAEPRCGSNYGAVADAIACYNYLRGLGQTPCTVGAGKRSEIMCTAGTIRIEGSGIGASSWCEHVAAGVLWTIDHCTRSGQDTAGYAPAYGNGDLIVGTQHR